MFLHLLISMLISQLTAAINPYKSDAILLSTRQRNSTLSNISHINVAGSTVPLSDTVKLLGVTLDKSLTFHKHVNLTSQSCYYHMKALHHIRHCLDDQSASLIAHALISSHLDYAKLKVKLPFIPCTLSWFLTHESQVAKPVCLVHPTMSLINSNASRILSPESSFSLIPMPL
jgi:hypothetical protein